MPDNWLPTRLADQADMFGNVRAKIAGYTSSLPLTAGQVTAIEKLCDTFVAVYTYGEQYRASDNATITWRDSVIKGKPQGTPAPDPPIPPTLNMPAGATIGILGQFREYRDIILASPGYTQAIGEDLMIVVSGGGRGPSTPTGDAVPSLKCQVGSGYEVSITGAMHGMDAMRIEWQPNGTETWSLVGFLTRTPGTVVISPPTPGQPVSGHIRGRYIHNNLPVGDYSPEYAVTVAQ